MQRINTPDSLFHDGDQSTGVQGTLVLAAWLNAVQEELAKTIEGLGLTLDPAQSNQLLTALQSMFVNVGGDSMTGNLTLPELRVGDVNARIKRIGTMLALENDVDLSFVAGKTGVYLESNAKHDGTNYNRIDTSQPAALLRVFRDGTIYLYRAAAGANPIAWDPALTLWHSGNDGAGSGLDADLLDGMQPATAATASTIAQRDGAGALAVANATATAHAVALGQFGASQAASGYVKLPNGIIIQWLNFGVSVGANTTASYSQSFPIAFPTGCLFATATQGNYVANNVDVESWSASAASGFVQNGGAAAVTQTVLMIVIGY